MAVLFLYNEVKPNFPNKRKLKDFISSMFHGEHKELNTLTYIFCSDDYLLEINKSYLQHNYYTDIITFDLSSSKKLIDGEIYISIDRVKENAQRFNQSFNRELHRVIFHGALHLCGYKDKTPKEEKKMREMEEKYLSQYFI